MDDKIDLDLPNRLEFRVNHEQRRIESNDPNIWVEFRGRTMERGKYYFSVHWNGRDIPVETSGELPGFGRNDKGQVITEADWKILSLGNRDGAAYRKSLSYQFKSRDEMICVASIAVKALKVFGGHYHDPKINYHPVARRISADLSTELRSKLYGGTN